jgi:hypothetical protein
MGARGGIGVCARMLTGFVRMAGFPGRTGLSR